MSQQYSRWQDLQRQPGQRRGTSQLEELRLRVHQFVIDQVGPKLSDDDVDEDELRRLVQEQVHKALSEENIALSAAERAQLIQDVTDDTLGYGPIDRFLHDPGITEVMVNGPKTVYIERRGKIERTDVEFVDEDHLRRTIDKIVSQVGRRIDEASPMVDARLPDGSRVNAVIHPVAIGGPFLTIRRFSKDPYTVDDLINFGTLTPQVAHFLDACVRGQLNVVDLRRYRYREDDAAQRACRRSSRTTSASSRSRTPRSSGSRRTHVVLARGAPAERRGQGRGQDPRARAQLAAYAARPDHRR